MTRIWILLPLTLASAGLLAGCDTNNRVPTKAEGQAADVKRQAFIDSLKIPPEQKAIMKAQMGGPPVQTAMDRAKAAASAPGQPGRG